MITDALRTKRPANTPIPGSTRDIARTALEAAHKATQGAVEDITPTRKREARVSPLRTTVYLMALFVEGFKAKTSKRACKRLAWQLGMVGSFVLLIVSPTMLGTIVFFSVLLSPLVLVWRIATWKTRRKLGKESA